MRNPVMRRRMNDLRGKERFLTMFRMTCLFIVFNLFLCHSLFSQSADESGVVIPAPASLDTLSADTTRSTSDLDTIVTYSADLVRSTVDPRVTLLTGDAKVEYQDMLLMAEKIEVWWDEHLIKAEGKLDTVRTRRTGDKTDSLTTDSQADSLGTEIDTATANDDYKLEWIGLPEMKDGTQTIVGHRMTYDLRSRRGRVLQGETGLEDGDYTGKKIKRLEKNLYYIESANYTTCDYDDPHYVFWSKEAKLVIKDKVVSRPVVLKFGPVPVMIIPFAVFPTKGGRHSGLIIPTYGETAGQGRYFRNLGYFWAANDYFDLTTKLNFYERSGIQLYSNARYKLRYVLNGRMSGSWVNQSGNKQWDIAAYHNHTLSPTARLVMDAKYATASYYDDYSLNLYERLNKTMRSNLTLTKNWEGSPYSGSVNLGYEENLITGQVTQKFPIIRFSRSQSAIIPPAEGTKPEDIRWWNEIFFSYSGEVQNRKNVKSTALISIDTVTGGVETDYSLSSQLQRGANHSVNISARPKSLEYVSVTPSFSYKETWYDEWYGYNQLQDGTIDTVEQDGFRARRTFSGSVGFNTKLYGIFKPGLLSIEAIRHTLSPSVSFGYTPDFSEPKWGYYKIFSDSAGKKTYYDEFARNTLYGGTPRNESMSMSISLGNLFEYKQLKDDKVNKGELFTLNNSTGINFLADSLKWQDLTSTMRVRPFGGDFGGVSGLSLTLTSHHSFYKLMANSEGRKIVVSDPAPDGLRLLDFNLRSSFNVEGEAGISSSDEQDTTGYDRQIKDRFDNPEWKPSPLPWKAGINLRYYESRADPDNIRITQTAGLNLDVTITDNWKASYSTTYDIKDKKVTSSSISLYRDLHCWEGRLNWNPTGVGKGYYLIINIKASQLHDVKVEKRKGGGGIYSF